MANAPNATHEWSDMLSSPSSVLNLQHLRHRWPGAAVNALSLEELQLQAGQTVLVRGNSGSGKSTLLSIAAGVTLATQGDVCFLGTDWRHMSQQQRDRVRADHIGFVFQQFNLLPYLSALDNVVLPCRFSRRRALHAGDPLEAAKQLLSALDLSPAHWQQPAAQLSVGQQQRVAAARALIGSPELVIADEPTSALDLPRRDAFMQLLLAQCHAAGSALLFVTHDPQLSVHFSNTIDLERA